MKKRTFLSFAAAACAAPVALAQTETYPARPIKFLVGYAAGGNTDVYARMVAERMSKSLGQPIVVENRPGASGVLATKLVAESRPDGYTLLMTSNTSMTMIPALRAITGGAPLGYRVPQDFSFIGLLGEAPAGIVVRAELGVNSFDELVAVSKKTPLRLATPGAGNATQVFLELLDKRAALKSLAVPYAGLPVATPDILAGRIDGFIGNFGSAKSLIDSGKFRLIAVFSTQRVEAFPQVKTLKEQGVDIVGTGLWGLVGPAGMPQEVVARLSSALSAALKDPSFKNLLVDQGSDLKDLPMERFREYVTDEMRWYAEAIKSVPGMETRLSP